MTRRQAHLSCPLPNLLSDRNQVVCGYSGGSRKLMPHIHPVLIRIFCGSLGVHLIGHIFRYLRQHYLSPTEQKSK
jgi:hypothetical protein